jgi:hypothetical protein
MRLPLTVVDLHAFRTQMWLVSNLEHFLKARSGVQQACYCTVTVLTRPVD